MVLTPVTGYLTSDKVFYSDPLEYKKAQAVSTFFETLNKLALADLSAWPSLSSNDRAKLAIKKNPDHLYKLVQGLNAIYNAEIL